MKKVLRRESAKVKCTTLQRRTSRPSQNSASVIWRVMTSSRCSAARSGFASRTFLRIRKSTAGSLPTMTGVEARSVPLTMDAARECMGPAPNCEARGVGGADEVGDGAAEREEPARADTGRGAADTGAAVACVFLLRAMTAVNSVLKCSRSATASSWGRVKVKLCPSPPE